MRDSVMLKYFVDSEFLSIEECETKTRFTEDVKKHKNNLYNTLNKEQLKEFQSFKRSFENHMLTIKDKECLKMFYLGILLGMEVNDFYHKENEEE